MLTVVLSHDRELYFLNHIVKKLSLKLKIFTRLVAHVGLYDTLVSCVQFDTIIDKGGETTYIDVRETEPPVSQNQIFFKSLILDL